MQQTSTPKQLSPSRQSDQFVLRFPAGMRDALKAQAAANRRSLNAELIVLIEAGQAAVTAHAQEAAK